MTNSTTNNISIFANQPPATKSQVEGFIKQLKIRFPNLGPLFWDAVATDIAREGLSYDRLAYIYDQKIHGGKIFDISDILGVDKKMEILSYHEYYKRFNTTEAVNGWCKLKQRDAADYTQYCLKADALAAGLEIYE